jgi:ribosomal protein L7/L12
VVLRGYPPERKIALIRLVRGLTNLGLKESKDLIERPLPFTLLRNQSPVEANRIRLRLESVCDVGIEPATG